MNAPSVLLFDYGSGNLRSAQRALEKVGADVTVSADFDAAMAADGLLVPGVGAYGACMKGIKEVRGDILVDRRLSGGRPVMGICVGMQVMFDQGVEHAVETEGLGQWPGVVEELQAPILPHMGWNTVRVAHDSMLFEGVMGERFYFVHSYAARRWDFVARDENQNSPEVTWSHHGEDFVAAVENGPLVATQFHPEKSGDAGLHLLENWVKSLR